MMLERGAPLTREAYLAFAYPGNLPKTWGAEHEMELPEPFRRKE